MQVLRGAALEVFLLSFLCWAQLGTEGSILGNVTDASGAMVAGASVEITNTDTGFTTTVSTNNSGYFEADALPLGKYTVSASQHGFTTWQIAGVVLHAREQKRVQPVLQVGQMQQQVTVQAGPELVQTERASVETAIEQKQIRDLPLNGRIAMQLVELTPGMRYLGMTQSNVQGLEVQGMGQHTDATQFQVDGLSANDPSSESGMAFPNLEAIDQFQVQTSSFSAENGRDPLQVTMITKSGTNEFHGSLWEFLRNDKLDARNTFAATKPFLRRNQYGFSAGGPGGQEQDVLFRLVGGIGRPDAADLQFADDRPGFCAGRFLVAGEGDRRSYHGQAVSQ